MTASEIYKDILSAAKNGYVSYVCTTKRKLNVVMQKIANYEICSKVDFEIGVIDEKQYKIELVIVDHMKKAVKLADII